MIFYCIFKLLHWLYGWGEITNGTRLMMTILSGSEMLVVSFVLVGLCFNELPDIIRDWRKRK